jgi:ADP-L-glycero-D-manno-heptose 6-epimerase
MIVITGGAGFIGSAVIWRLNQMGIEDIVIVDELRSGDKWKNLVGLKFIDIYHKNDFLDLIINENVPFNFETMIHLGACSSTTEEDTDYLLQNNFRYSKELANYCVKREIRFIYASSAATYGDGSNGYDDEIEKVNELRPLNKYGYSKHLFDKWIYKMHYYQRVVGLKYFNVYGPNEFHKGDMRSVVHKAFQQIRDTGKVKLFKSYRDEYADGEQKRDFIYVKDAVDMTLHFVDNWENNGIFNIGTGNARSWNDLVKSIFNALGEKPDIEYIEMPEYLREKYQYFTQAKVDRLREAGYDKEITPIEEGVKDYVQNYLMNKKYLGM